MLQAIELGAPAKTLRAILDADRLKRAPYIVLPAGRYDHLSRGRGWARKGTGATVEWGDKHENGWKVATPGVWTVGSTDGYNRKENKKYTVKHLQVGDQTWTIAN